MVPSLTLVGSAAFYMSVRLVMMRVADIATVLQPGDTLKAEEMAQTFRQRIAQAEEMMARADMLRFQPGVNIQCLVGDLHQS
ncbi:hypothetical protein IFM89_025613, partial [Coptis chinensis]